MKFNLFFSVFFWLQRYFPLSARARRCRSLLLHPWAKGTGGEVTAVSRRTKKGDLTCAGARQPEHGHVLGPPPWGWQWPRQRARCLAALPNAGGKPAMRLPLGRFQGEDFEHTTSKGMKGEGSDGYQETGFTTLKESSPPLRLWLHPALIHFLSIFPFISPLLLGESIPERVMRRHALVVNPIPEPAPKPRVLPGPAAPIPVHAENCDESC